MAKNFIKVKEAVNEYGIGKNNFYQAIHEGTLKAYKPNGRDFLIKVSDIEAWIESKPVQKKGA